MQRVKQDQKDKLIQLQTQLEEKLHCAEERRAKREEALKGRLSEHVSIDIIDHNT
jgi:hypothetical protein